MAKAKQLARSSRDVVRIATRKSEVALRQAKLVQAALAARGVTTELVTFVTIGDKKHDESLAAISANGVFTNELEQALAAGKVDCCVHSLKDLPTALDDDLVLAAVLERDDPRDVLVVNDRIDAESIAELPRGSRVGTSSVLCRAQLLHARRDIEVVELRGDLPMRLRKVDDGQVHAAVLSASGLRRLDVRQHIDAWLDPPQWLPAVGQGAIAIQVRTEDAWMRELLSPLDHPPTAVATRAERACLRALEGGSQVPIGALATPDGERLILRALLADPSGAPLVRGEIDVNPDDPERSGRALASELRRRGGMEILDRLRNIDKVPAPQPE